MIILAILQARVSSSRLPNKVLADLLGRPMLARQLERLVRSKKIDRLIVATSDDVSDDAVENICRAAEVRCFRGSLNDVLARFAGAYEAFGPADHVVRLTGDCPLADPDHIDMVIERHLQSGSDYTTNAIQPTWPDGLDVEVMTSAALKRAAVEARLPSEREHVTPFIHKQPELFSVLHVKGETDLSNLRWTVDEPADLAFVREVYAKLYPVNPDFRTDDILTLLHNCPELAEINGDFQRNEGYAKSLKADSL